MLRLAAARPQPRQTRTTRCAASQVDALRDALFTAPARKRAKAALLSLIRDTERGVLPAPGGRAAVEAAVDALAELAPPGAATARLSASWQLLWTSERETLFLLEKGLFGVGPATAVVQEVDVARQTLANRVEFGDQAAAFVVDASLSVEGDSRCSFRFRSARLERPVGLQLVGLPPFGAGWFDSVYVDEDLRCARDSRGDTLIVRR